MARKLVVITLILWLLLLIFATSVHWPEFALIPFYGLYPGEVLSTETTFHPNLMLAWAIGAGVVFLALAIAAMWRKNKVAGIAFMVLWLLSTVVAFVRFLEALSHGTI
jgi:hypothetical protein